jgi:hypothetical protein
MPRSAPLVITLAVALAFGAGCVDDAQFTVRNAPDFTAATTATISVFGVYQDGIMSADAWDALGPKLSPSLHAGICDVAYGPAHIGKNPALAQAITEYTRDNGVTEALFTEIIPMTTSDFIVAFTVSGHPRPPEAKTSLMNGSPAPRPIRGSMNPPPRGSRAEKRSRSSYEMSASIFSTKLHHSVALLSMKYGGESEPEAQKAFIDKLRAFLPNTTCVPFSDAPIDELKIRALPSSRDEETSPAPSQSQSPSPSPSSPE